MPAVNVNVTSSEDGSRLETDGGSNIHVKATEKEEEKGIRYLLILSRAVNTIYQRYIRLDSVIAQSNPKRDVEKPDAIHAADGHVIVNDVTAVHKHYVTEENSNNQDLTQSDTRNLNDFDGKCPDDTAKETSCNVSRDDCVERQVVAAQRVTWSRFDDLVDYRVCVVDNRMYILGGKKPGGAPRHSSRLRTAGQALSPRSSPPRPGTARDLPGQKSVHGNARVVGTGRGGRGRGRKLDDRSYGVDAVDQLLDGEDWNEQGRKHWRRVRQILKYDPMTGRWMEMSPMRIGRTGHTATAYNHLIIVTGGTSADNEITDSCELYDVTIDQWTRIGSLPSPRHLHACVELNGKLYVSGGASTTEVANDNLWEFSHLLAKNDRGFNGCVWRIVSVDSKSDSLQKLSRHCAVAIDKHLVLIGGVCNGRSIDGRSFLPPSDKVILNNAVSRHLNSSSREEKRNDYKNKAPPERSLPVPPRRLLATSNMMVSVAFENHRSPATLTSSFTKTATMMPAGTVSESDSLRPTTTTASVHRRNDNGRTQNMIKQDEERNKSQLSNKNGYSEEKRLWGYDLDSEKTVTTTAVTASSNVSGCWDRNRDKFQRNDIQCPITSSLPCLPVARSGAAVVLIDSKLYVFGGHTTEPDNLSTTTSLDSIDCYDITTGRWVAALSISLSLAGAEGSAGRYSEVDCCILTCPRSNLDFVALKLSSAVLPTLQTTSSTSLSVGISSLTSNTKTSSMKTSMKYYNGPWILW